MNQIEYIHAINEERVTEALTYLEAPGASKKQLEYLAKIKRKHSGVAVFGGFFFLMLSLVAILGGIVYVMPLFLISGLIMVPVSLMIIYRSLSKYMKASKAEPAKSLTDICVNFYSIALSTKDGMVESKLDRMMSIAHIFPLPVLKDYEESGWTMFTLNSASKGEIVDSVECAICHKRTENITFFGKCNPVMETGHPKTKLERDELIRKMEEGRYLKCDFCANIICFDHFCYERPITQRYICPFCGKSKSGWGGLAARWKNQNGELTNQEISASQFEVSVTSTRNEGRIKDIEVRAAVDHATCITFKNVAIKNGEEWYLASPEPGERLEHIAQQ